ncbi:GNAT family protein [Geomonas anaerohicana]|uniref:GNAT family N-acetyltransferase n=1 Tax=Geomonas anaerohicana TaxID=2798583 RepID=A0ABS0YK34_9BACT|nr:GNAT family N-acetyltransferase [Geomonas anaerohicana]MBJ6752698.1 GNAT family N-acetyltransferase [Geomonas anaerohicana]
MSVLVKTGNIFDHIANKDEEYKIFRGIDPILYLNTDRKWLQYNLDLMQAIDAVANGDDLIFEKMIRECSFEDFHWRWFDKCYDKNTSEFEWFYLTVGDVVQGVCILYHPKESRIDKEEIFYIDYLATAPWNRPDVLKTPIPFKGIGTLLLREALTFSLAALGYRPGFSLHSLPKALTYYHKIGMTDFGPDGTYHNLHYLEMERESSEVFANA